MQIKLLRKDSEDGLEPILLGIGKHSLGRGMPLQCQDKRISRNHCVIEVSCDGTAELNATHTNPCFYYASESQTKAVILKKGENKSLQNGDLISLLPDSYQFIVIFIPDVAENAKGAESQLEDSLLGTDTSYVVEGNTPTLEDIEALEKAKVQESNEDTEIVSVPQKAENDSEKTVFMSDHETVSLPKDDDTEDLVHCNIPSPSILDDATSSPAASTIQTTLKRHGEDNEEEISSQKRPRPKSPEDIKPNIADLQVIVNPLDVPAACSVKKETDDVPDAGGVKTEPKVDRDDEEASSGGPSSPATAKPAATVRTKCSFTSSCNRRNPQHRVEYCHPGDLDWAPTPCQWGAACYRQNPQHRAMFTHPGPPAPRPAPQPAVQGWNNIPQIMRVERHGIVFNIIANTINLNDELSDVEDFYDDSADHDYEF